MCFIPGDDPAWVRSGVLKGWLLPGLKRMHSGAPGSEQQSNICGGQVDGRMLGYGQAEKDQLHGVTVKDMHVASPSEHV